MGDTEMFGLKTPIVTVATDHFWYKYRQNNSGGRFDIDDDVSVHVLIQAEDKYAANRKAEEVGIYFEGCSQGRDCDCCGDRWDEAWDALEEFSVYRWKDGQTTKTYDSVLDYAQALADEDDWAGKQHSVVVYFAIKGAKTKFWNSKPYNPESV